MKMNGLDTEKTYTVGSEKDPSVFYDVTFEDNEWKCTCPAFMYRKDLTKPCKHIKKLIEQHEQH